jgi:hypothetical protein
MVGFVNIGEDRETGGVARSPDSRPGPRGAFNLERLALSYDAL